MTKKTKQITTITSILKDSLPKESMIMKAPKKKKKKSKSKSLKTPKTNLASLYAASLNDPFEHSGVRLGFGTLSATNLYCAFVRSSFTLNADGSGAIVLLPTVGVNTGGLLFNNAGHATITWTVGSGFTDKTAIGNSCSEARVVSVGLRVLPQVAATSPPGIIACGQFTSSLTSNLVTTSMTPDSILAQPQFRVGYGALGGSACGRPLDIASYQFTTTTVFGDAAGTYVWNYGSPAISLTGFPASTVCLVEAVLNIEALLPSTYASTTAMEQTGESNDTVADSYPSVETLWSKIKNIVGAPGYVDHVGGIAENFGKAAANTLMNRYFNNGPINDMVLIQDI